MNTLFLAAGLALSMITQAEVTINCPEDYPTRLIETKNVPGWNGISHFTGYRLVPTSAGVLVGDPLGEAQGIQYGKVGPKTKSGFKVQFTDLNKFVEPQKKWVYCAYGLDGNAQLLQKIADNTDKCVANYRLNTYGGYDISITCH